MSSIKQSTECATGNHVFIISRWLIGTQNPQSQQAHSFTCQRCLYSIEGRNEVEKVVKAYENDTAKTTDISRATTRGKDNKGRSGEGEAPQG